MNRRQFVKDLSLGALAASTLPVFRSAHAAEFTYKIAHSTPTTHPLHIRLTEAAAKIKADTKGRFELQVFPSDQLGAQTDVLGQVRSGATDFFALSGVVLSTLVPAAAISGVGFAFKSYDAVWKAMDGNLGAFIRAEIDKTRSLFAFEKVWDNGFRQITSSNRPVATPKDLQGMKIRVPPSSMWVSLFKALDALPTTITANELYSSLQDRRCAGEPARGRVQFQALRSAEVLLSHEPHVGWILDSREPQQLRRLAARRTKRRQKASE